jgi:hypothetical protein
MASSRASTSAPATLRHEHDAGSTAALLVEALRGLEALGARVLGAVEARALAHGARLEALERRAAAAAEGVRRVEARGRAGRATTIVATARLPSARAASDEALFAWEALPPAREAREAAALRLGLDPSAVAPAGATLGDEAQNVLALVAQLAVGDALWFPPAGSTAQAQAQASAPALRLASRGGPVEIPLELASVADALLFGSADSAFGPAAPAAALAPVPQAARLAEDDEDEAGSARLGSGSFRAARSRGQRPLPAAPKSVLDAEALPDVSEYDVSFKPRMKSLDSFKMPSSLDLPDIADIHFASSADAPSASIAPSVIENSDLSELPAVLDFGAPPVFMEPQAPPNVRFEVLEPPKPLPPSQPQQQQQPSSSHPKLQSSPEQPRRQVSSTSAAAAAAAASSSSAAAASSPLSSSSSSTLPPPQQQQQPPQLQLQQQEPPPQALAPREGSMNDLLAAIRNKDNLAKLKSNAEARRRQDANSKQEPASSKQQEQPGSQAVPATAPKAAAPLSLADEMRLKLARRQKVLSGALDDEEQAADQARVAALNGTMLAVGAAVKFKRAVTGSPRQAALERSKRLSLPSGGALSLSGIQGLDEILSAKEQGSQQQDDSDASWD